MITIWIVKRRCSCLGWTSWIIIVILIIAFYFHNWQLKGLSWARYAFDQTSNKLCTWMSQFEFEFEFVLFYRKYMTKMKRCWTDARFSINFIWIKYLIIFLMTKHLSHDFIFNIKINIRQMPGESSHAKWSKTFVNLNLIVIDTVWLRSHVLVFFQIFSLSILIWPFFNQSILKNHMYFIVKIP